MRIIVDCMGGDHAPLEIVKGVARAAETVSAEWILVGDENAVRACADAEKIDLSGFTLCHTSSAVTMEDDPTCVLREKADSSMAIGLKKLRGGEGDVFVSAGNTGALFTGAMLIVRKIKGLQRAGIAAILPLANPVLLLDSGANVEVTEENLVHFARMGSAYMQSVFGLKNPRVGLLNNGTEDCKGRELQQNARRKLAELDDICFVGNIEGKEAVLGGCDVLVTDGFTGNILIKTVEGMGKLMFSELGNGFRTNGKTKLAYLLMKKPLRQMKHKFDVNEVGGAPILGISKPVIKAHGSSNAKAFASAIRQAVAYADSSVIADISAVMEAGARHVSTAEKE